METESAFLTILIAIALFFILRPLFLWYWKVNEIIDLLRKQVTLLESIKKIDIASQLMGPDSEKILEHESIELLGSDQLIYDYPDDITVPELDKININAKKLISGELITIHKKTREIDTWETKSYNATQKNVKDWPYIVVARMG